MKYIFIDILRLAKLYWPRRSFKAYFSESIKDNDVKFWHKHYSSLQLVLLRIGVDIFSSLETMRCNRFNGNVAISVIFNSCLITFDRKENFEFWLFHRKDLVQIYQSHSYFELQIYIFIYKISFWVKKLLNLGFLCAEFFSNHSQRLVIL